MQKAKNQQHRTRVRTPRQRDSLLVLLHGYPLDHHTWDFVAPMLEGDVRSHHADLRGFEG
ncbi:MAG: hypothetical protein U0V48_14940 [Anaerolineales bacterium]